jgi:hypothetical protein
VELSGIFFLMHKTNSNPPGRKLAQLAGAVALGALFAVSALAQPTTLYSVDFSSSEEGRIAGWSRAGGYAKDTTVVADQAENSSTRVPAFCFDSQTWGADVEKDGTDTEVFGDTGVSFVPGTVYQVAVTLARRATGPKQVDDSPFFGAFLVELYAGDPREGGRRIGETESPAKPDPATAPERLVLTSRASATGKGNLFIRLATERARGPAPKGDAYQQAEVSLVALRAVSGPGAKPSR